MKVYLLRHGIAEDRSPSGTDAARRLTAEGEAEMRQVARGIRKLGLRFDVILSSPLVRARQTAEAVAREMDAEDRLTEEPRLASGARFGDFCAVLDDRKPGDRVLLVGHEPDLSSAISTFIGGGGVRMKKASLALVDLREVAAEGGELRWLLEAEQLSAVD
jgi:phosphohistidine phosphatase